MNKNQIKEHVRNWLGKKTLTSNDVNQQVDSQDKKLGLERRLRMEDELTTQTLRRAREDGQKEKTIWRRQHLPRRL